MNFDEVISQVHCGSENDEYKNQKTIKIKKENVMKLRIKWESNEAKLENQRI